MEWPARVATSRHRKSAQRAYRQACLHVAPHQPAQPVSWWGLCALLSRHYLRRGTIRTQPELWTELFPFLLVGDERTAERAVEEYLVYLDDPRAADVESLGIQINRALEQADSWNGSIAAVLPQPALVFEARWMALLAYQNAAAPPPRGGPLRQRLRPLAPAVVLARPRGLRRRGVGGGAAGSA